MSISTADADEFRAGEDLTVESIVESYGPTSVTPDSVECLWAVAIEADTSLLDYGGTDPIAYGQDSHDDPSYWLGVRQFPSATEATEFRTQIVNGVGSCPSAEVAGDDYSGDDYSSVYTYHSLVDHGDFVTWIRSENARIGFAVFTAGDRLVIVRTQGEVVEPEFEQAVESMIGALAAG